MSLDTSEGRTSASVTTTVNGVSVIVCCYNSVERLSPTLAHLAWQRVPEEVAWEVIVIDNASTDGTAETASKAWHGHGVDVPFQVVAQPKPGLSAAREMGLDRAAHDILIFCDDDNWLAPDYVHRAYELMRSSPRVAVLGGRGTPALSGDAPTWFARYATYYALGPQGESPGDITDFKGYVYGAGLVLRRSAWEELRAHGFTSQLTGRKGTSLASSEDRELCYALRLRGHRIHYEDGLQFKHEIPERRLTWPYFLKMVEMAHRTTPVMEAYALALSGNTVAEAAARRMWRGRCWDLVSKVLRKPTILVGAARAREGSSAAVQWRRITGAWRGWTAIRHRYAEVLAAATALRAKRLRT